MGKTVPGEPINQTAVLHPCPHCGDLMPQGARICPHCGFSFAPGSPVLAAGLTFLRILVAVAIGLIVVPLGLCGARFVAVAGNQFTNPAALLWGLGGLV